MTRFLTAGLVVVAVGLGLLWYPPASVSRNWTDGSEHGRWRVVYTGYGQVSGSDSHVRLAPRSPEADDVTHAALVTTRDTYPEADFEVSVHTEQQLREGRPNPWEVGWVLWNYRPPSQFYAVALKPNGWEISKQDAAYRGAQRFLATGTKPRFPVRQTHRVRVTQREGGMTVSANGHVLARVTDTERPYRGGAIGLYTEDAAVTFSDLKLISPGPSSIRK